MSPGPKFNPCLLTFLHGVILILLIFLMILPLLILFVLILITTIGAKINPFSKIPAAFHITVGTFKFLISLIACALAQIPPFAVLSITVDLHLKEFVAHVAAAA